MTWGVCLRICVCLLSNAEGEGCRLGKTIQMLVRIMDNRPSQTDAREGWAAPTLFVSLFCDL
jgi:hypothetical protein